MQFDMNRTWSEAVALVKTNFQLLAIIAGVFMLLPGLAIYVANPEMLTLLFSPGDPAAMEAMVAALPASFFLWGLASFLIQLIGYSAMIALMGSDRPTVGQAIVRGVKSLPSVIGAFIVFIVGFVIVAFALSLVLGLIVALIAGVFGLVAGTGENAGTGILTLVISLLVLVLELYVLVRFMMTLPVIVLEQEYNPFKALIRSWRLTKPKAWAIVRFIALLAVAYLVIILVLTLVISALGLFAAGTLSTGSIIGSALLLTVIGVLVAMIASGILISIYRQLTGGGQPAAIGPNG